MKKSDKIQKVLFTKVKIDKLTTLITSKLNQLVYKKPIMLLGIMNGALYFMTDISRKFIIDHSISVCKVKSHSEGKFEIEFFEELSNNYHYVILDEICDSGNTLKILTEELVRQGVTTITTVSLLERKTSSFSPDIIGEKLDTDAYLYGYGLDDNNLKRNISFIYYYE